MGLGHSQTLSKKGVSRGKVAAFKVVKKVRAEAPIHQDARHAHLLFHTAIIAAAAVASSRAVGVAERRSMSIAADMTVDVVDTPWPATNVSERDVLVKKVHACNTFEGVLLYKLIVHSFIR